MSLVLRGKGYHKHALNVFQVFQGQINLSAPNRERMFRSIPEPVDTPRITPRCCPWIVPPAGQGHNSIRSVVSNLSLAAGGWRGGFRVAMSNMEYHVNGGVGVEITGVENFVVECCFTSTETVGLLGTVSYTHLTLPTSSYV